MIKRVFTQDVFYYSRPATGSEMAGGYVEILGCMRAVQEAMAGLYFVPGDAN